MIKQITAVQVEPPHISANELAKYVFSTPAEKKEILRNQKFPPAYRVSYYARALQAILASFHEGQYHETELLQAAERIAALPAKSKQEASKNKCNAEAVHHFCRLRELAIPPTGNHQFIRQNAHLMREEVKISIRPEIITSNLGEHFFAYTKLRFSKDKYSADAAEIGLLLLLIYGHAQVQPRIQFDIEKSKLIDCFSNSVIEGHRIPNYRQKQLDDALREIASVWDQIKARN